MRRNLFGREPPEMDDKHIAVMKYMDLRIKGFGAGLTESDIAIINNISDEEWKEIRRAIHELGGTLPLWHGDTLGKPEGGG
jgi:hypothetical protein